MMTVQLKQTFPYSVKKKKKLRLLLDEEIANKKRHKFGLIKFIGELYKLKILTSQILLECTTVLLNKGGEESLQCLCILLSAIGKELQPESKDKELYVYFQEMLKMVQKSRIKPSTLKFVLQDKTYTVNIVDIKVDEGVSEGNVLKRSSLDAETVSGITGDVNEIDNSMVGVIEDPSSFFQAFKSAFAGCTENITVSLGSNPCTEDFRLRAGVNATNAVQPAASSSLSTARTTRSTIRSMVGRGFGTWPSSTNGCRTALSNLLPDPLKTYLTRCYSDQDATVLPTTSTLQYQKDLVKKVKTIMAMWLSGSHLDIQEIVQKVQDAFVGKSNLKLFIRYAIHLVLKRRRVIARFKTGYLLAILVLHDTIPLKELIKEFASFIVLADDIEVYLPRIWHYIGELTAPVIAQEVFTFTHLRSIAEPVRPSKGLALTLARIIRILIREKGPDWTSSAWDSSEVQITDFVPDEHFDLFIRESTLDFVVHESPDNRRIAYPG